jgi:hypothetical protein
MLGKGIIKNGQSRERWNIGYKTHNEFLPRKGAVKVSVYVC